MWTVNAFQESFMLNMRLIFLRKLKLVESEYQFQIRSNCKTRVLF